MVKRHQVGQIQCGIWRQLGARSWKWHRLYLINGLKSLSRQMHLNGVRDSMEKKISGEIWKSVGEDLGDGTISV